MSKSNIFEVVEENGTKRYKPLGGGSGSKSEIDDSTKSDKSTYSSNKIEELITNVKTTVDASLSTTSENPVQNKVITEVVNGIENRISDNWNGNGYNLIPYPYYDGMNYTNNGMTYSVSPDGSISASGTNNSGSNSNYIIQPANIRLKSGRYRIIGSPNKENYSEYRILIRVRYGGTNHDNFAYTGNEKDEFEITEEMLSYDDFAVGVILRVYSKNIAYTNLVFNPMLVEVAEDGSYPTEYQRYASGNVELTDNINDIENRVDTNAYAENGIHNLLKLDSNITPALYGIELSVNADKSIKVTGQANRNTGEVYITTGYKLPQGRYILSPTNVDDLQLQITDYPVTKQIALSSLTEDEFTLTTDTLICVRFIIQKDSTYNNVIYPMIRKFTDIDDTYSPYTESNLVLTNKIENNAYAENGIHNLLKNTATSQTFNGVTFTVNADGSVTCNGTANNQLSFVIKETPTSAVGAITLPAGTYKISGGYSTNCAVDCTVNGVYYSSPIRGTTDTFTITNPTTLDFVRIRVERGTTLNNVTVYPMIRRADDTDTTYRPYVKSNAELTKDSEIVDFYNKVTWNVSLFTQSYIKKYGKLVDFYFSVSNVLEANKEVVIAIIPQEIRPFGNIIIPTYVNGVKNGSMWIKTNGEVTIHPDTTSQYIGTHITYLAN